jgi:hypothetical protein
MPEPDFRAALQQLADAVDGWEMEPADGDPLRLAMDHARKVLFPRLARFAPDDPDPEYTERLAEIIREVDGKHELGAAALAEAILAHPSFSGCHDGPVAPPVSPVEPISVVITEAQNIGEGEVYTDWYLCPNCKDDMITHGSNFCPRCGVKLQWKEGATHA